LRLTVVSSADLKLRLTDQSTTKTPDEVGEFTRGRLGLCPLAL